MSNDIKRKELWATLNNIRQSDWIRAAKKLKLDIIESKNGSHTCNIRDPKNKNLDDVRGVIATLQINLYKQANRSIFNRLFDFGILEDDIWKAFDLL